MVKRYIQIDEKIVTNMSIGIKKNWRIKNIFVSFPNSFPKT